MGDLYTPLGDGLLGSEADGEIARQVVLQVASSVRVDRPSWLWEGRVPVGGVTLMVGREGEGKTAKVGALAASVTRGTLPGAFYGTPADVVYIGSEDDHSTVLVPRLIAAGADLERFHFVHIPAGATFSVSIDLDALGQAVTRLDRLALVVVDPLDSHLGSGIDTHKKAEVQAAIARLAVLTQRARCAAVGIAHMNKGDSRDVLGKVVGSVGFTTAVRSVLAVGQHPDEPTDRVLVVRKANMTDARSVPAVRFRVEGTEVPHPDGGPPIDTAMVVQLGEELGLDPNAILSVPDAEERTARTEAAEWLAELLGDGGPVPAKEVKRLARDADIAERTLHRAREALAVVVERDETARGRPSTWRLPAPTVDGGSMPPDSRQPLCGTNGTKPETGSDLPFPGNDFVSCHGANTGRGTEQGTCSACGEPTRHPGVTLHPTCEPTGVR